MLFLHRNLSRALCLWLMITLLATSTPAAPQVAVGLASELNVSFAFWLRSSDVVTKIKRALFLQNRSSDKRQEKQKDRDARARRIQVHPGDVTVGVGQTVVFAAVAYDQNDVLVGGVRFSWRAEDENGNAVRISSSGEFAARREGNFTITVEGAGLREKVKVKVKDGVKRKDGDRPLGRSTVSTREKQKEDRNKGEGNQAHGKRNRTVTAAPPMPLPGDGWDSTNYTSADDPGNRVGNVPGAAADGGAGSGNFQLSAPVLSLPGRGIDLGLALSYNSRVWNKAGSGITFDIDRGWPAPGWSFGFSKVLGMGVYAGSMIVEADGTRHPYTGTVTEYSWGTIFAGHTIDGSFIDYTHTTGIGGAIVDAQARYPNGTVVYYGARGNGDVYPTRITDADGNYITITYRNNTGPQIETITDTLGRTINFYYDSNNLLTAVVAPGLTAGTTRTLVRLHYRQLTLNYAFSGLTPRLRNATPWVVDAIYYPATNTGYWFGDSDSYSSYGMIAKVLEQRGMVFSASSLEDQGTITPGVVTRQSVYNYDLQPNSGLTDAPTYTTSTETWEGMDTGAAVTNYSAQPDANPRVVSMTLPNGTKSTQYSYNYSSLPDTDPLKALDGLVYLDETRDSNNNLLGSSSSTWEKGAYDSPRPLRVEIMDERNQTTAAEFSYDTGVYNQATKVRDYDYGGQNLLRETRTQYENGTAYTGRHIFSLVKSVEIYSSDAVTRVSRTEYQYDGQTLTDTPGVVMHSDASNPYAPMYTVPGDCNIVCDDFCHEVCESEFQRSDYDPATAYRGNVTQVKTYADASSLNETSAVTQTRRYDITGNMVTASTACCEQTSVGYTVDTQYAYPTSQTRGSATVATAQVTTSATYSFNTGLALTTTDANGRTSQASYFPETLRPQEATAPTGARTVYAYDDTNLNVTETTYAAASEGGAVASQNVKYLNGLGLVRQEKALGQGSVWDIADTQYDSMGRVWKQTRPYRSGQQLQWSQNFYDAMGRVYRVVAPDNSETNVYFNESSYPGAATPNIPGQTTRMVDAWGRERWGRTDGSGRLVEVVEPNPLGTGSVFDAGNLLTKYSYDPLGNLTEVEQGAQHRSFRYDSLGRLLRQKLAEQSATLNDDGVYVGTGGAGAQWSEVFTYDNRSNLTARVDARGVKTVFNYNNDPLNRIQSVSWDTTGFGDTTHPIVAAASVSYSYPTTGDVTRLESVTANGVSSETYGYDGEGRINSKSLTLTSRPNYPLTTGYIYDSLDRLTDVRYPNQYGMVAAPRKLVHHDYDVASRLSALKVDGVDYASNILYNASSQTTSLKVGASGANQLTESYDYDPQTGLLSNQKVQRAGNSLLDLTYNYLRAGTTSGRTGQLTGITNNLDTSHQKDRGYEYDTLGRLKKATGGSGTSPLWTQNYGYDRYGNRETVSATGTSSGTTLSAPSNLTAPSTSNTQVTLQWTGITGADHYEIERTSNISQNFQAIGTSQTATFSDTGVAQDTAYLYRVRAVDASGNKSAPSNVRLATTVAFTDNPLADPQNPSNTVPFKAEHLTQLRRAVNAVRVVANKQAAAWTHPDLNNALIFAADVEELRTKLEEALQVIFAGSPLPSYTDSTLSGQPFKRQHIQELRQAVNWGGTGGGGVGTALPIPIDGHAALSYDTATNRIVAAGFEYDAAGNQTRSVLADGTTKQRYQYDAAGRMVKVLSDSQSELASYTYGESNQRLISDEGGLRTYYSWSGGAVASEYTEVNASGVVAWSKNYIYLGNRLIATQQATGSNTEIVQYHHPDRLGTRLITNAQDTSVQEQVTLPYGVSINAETTGTTNRRFTSYDRSSVTGLDYAVNRHYDSSQGRFTQVDPIGMSAASSNDPQSMNMYAYCGNDPVNRVDPDGLFWGKLFRFIGKVLKVVMVVLAVALAVVATLNIGNPMIAGWVIAKLFIGSGLLLASAFGGPKVREIISVIGSAAAIAQQGPGIIVNFAAGAARSGAAVAPWLAIAGAVVNFLSFASGGGQQKDSWVGASDPCPPDKRRFFDWLNEPLGKMAQELDTTKALLFMQAAREGGWTMDHLDINQPLNNPFGVNKIKNRKPVGNVNYPSLDAAIGYWKQKFGDRVRGTRTAEDFAYGMQNPLWGQPYNSSPKYEGALRDLYPGVIKFMKLCGIQ
jgi:RHS repeat-associated protein